MINERTRPIWIASAWAVVTGLTGALVSNLGPWYFALKRPWFQPPDWLFGPVWSVIFVLSAWAFVRAWRNGARGGLVLAYVVNGILNVGWSGMFFGLRRADYAMYDVVALWLSVVVMMFVTARRDHLAAWLLVPYLVWVAFAGTLTWEIWNLNGNKL